MMKYRIIEHNDHGKIYYTIQKWFLIWWNVDVSNDDC